MTTIITKNGSGAPTAGQLTTGELAVDLTNKELYTKDSGGNVIKVGAQGGSTGTFTDLTATSSFTSPGIDDNATTTAITIDANENVTVGGTTAGNAGTINVSVGSPGSTVGGLQLWAGTSGSHFMQFGNSASGDGYYRGAVGYLHTSDALVAYSAGTERMRIDAAGNVGIGLTPSAWSTGKAVEIGFQGNALWGNAADEVIVSQNAYYNSGWKYATTRPATHYSQYNAAHRWFTAPSGTANSAITWTQAMTLDASGNLGIGTDNPVYLLDLQKTSPALRIKSTSTATGAIMDVNDTSGQLTFLNYNGDFVAGAFGANTAQFRTSNTERMRIDAVGNVGYSGKIFSSNNLQTPDGLQLYRNHANGECFLFDTTAAPYSGPLIFGTSNAEQMRLDASGNLLVGDTSSYLSSANRRVLQATGSTDGSILSLQGTSGDFYIHSGGGDTANVNVVNRANGYMNFFTNNTERMRIDASGRVGIGTGNLSQKLTVSDTTTTNTSTYVSVLSGTSGNAGITFGDNDANLSGGILYNNDDDALRFFKSGFTEAMRIDASGNVGIGGSISTAKLYVVGATNDSTQLALRAQNLATSDLFFVRNDGSMVAGIGSKMTLDASGNLLVGTTSNPSGGKVAIDYARGTSAGMRIKDTVGAGGTGVIADFYNSSNVSVGSITHNSSTTSYNPSSDARLKESIRDYDNALADVMKLKPRKYSWKATGAEDNGFIAQELLETPEFANRVNPLSVGDDPMYGVDYMKFVAVLTGAIQEQQAMIETLQAEVAALKGE